MPECLSPGLWIRLSQAFDPTKSRGSWRPSGSRRQSPRGLTDTPLSVNLAAFVRKGEVTYWLSTSSNHDRVGLAGATVSSGFLVGMRSGSRVTRRGAVRHAGCRIAGSRAHRFPTRALRQTPQLVSAQPNEYRQPWPARSRRRPIRIPKLSVAGVGPACQTACQLGRSARTATARARAIPHAWRTLCGHTGCRWHGISQTQSGC
jgi:hypothetical protein